MADGLRRLVSGEERRWRRCWAVLAGVAVLVVAWGSLTPASGLPDSLPWDKASHFLGYAGVAGLMGLAGMRLPLACAGTFLLGVGVELAQIPVPGRLGGDVADILANGLGAVAAALALQGLRLGLQRPSGTERQGGTG